MILIDRVIEIKKKSPANLTIHQGLRGKDGKAFTYQDFTPDQLMGLRGPMGPTGPRGEMGPPGPAGKQGRDGERGDVGPMGPQGSAGRQGVQGPKGEKGDTGLQGPAGRDGLNGIPGPQGPIGPVGPAGPVGPKGPQGEKGEPGIPFAFYKTYQSIQAMNADSNNVPLNKFVIIASTVNDPDNAKLFIKTGTGMSLIADLSGANGIQGPAGPAGPTGPSGQIGPTGPIGPRGEKGDRGEQGVAPEITFTLEDNGDLYVDVSYNANVNSITVNTATQVYDVVWGNAQPGAAGNARGYLEYSPISGFGKLHLDTRLTQGSGNGGVIATLPANAPVPTKLIEVSVNASNNSIYIEPNSRQIKGWGVPNNQRFIFDMVGTWRETN